MHAGGGDAHFVGDAGARHLTSAGAGHWNINLYRLHMSIAYPMLLCDVACR